MNSVTNTITNSEPTMSSREIAELVQSRHDSVKRTFERLAERQLITFTPTVETQKMPNGGEKGIDVYRVNKRDSYVVVAQLSPEFTARLVDRWQELEEQALKPQLPDFTNPAIAARACADEVEQKSAALALVAEKEVAIGNLAPKEEHRGYEFYAGVFFLVNAGMVLCSTSSGGSVSIERGTMITPSEKLTNLIWYEHQESAE